MNYDEMLVVIKTGTLLDLYRMSIAIRQELEHAPRVRQLRDSFKVGDVISYFDASTGEIHSAVAMQKNQKYVLVQHMRRLLEWKIPYYLLHVNTENKVSVEAEREPLSKLHLIVGDAVGFEEGEAIIRCVITRLNSQTATLLSGKDQKRYVIPYHRLFRIS